jgi:putative ABC transport system ATP-binding protein
MSPRPTAEPEPEPVPALALEGVRKSFSSGELTVEILHGIDLVIPRGKITVILGHSGSGKTTLLNLMGSLDQPTTGAIRFLGKDLTELDEKGLTEHRRQNLGFIFQLYNLIPTLTASENVTVACEGVKGCVMTPREALRLVGIEDKHDSFPAQMSGGEQQRVAIARAVARKPELMLCDEVTGALDSKTGRIILELMLHLNEEFGTTLVMITHAVPISRLADRVVRLDSGLVLEVTDNPERARVEDIDW